MSAPRPVDTGTLNRRVADLEKRLQALDASRRLSFAGSQVQHTNNGYGITTNWATIASTQITIPTWASTALIMATVTTSARWTEFFIPYFLRLGIAGTYGGETAAVYGATADEATSTTAWSGEIADAGGSTVTVAAQAMVEDLGQTEDPYPPTSQNTATVGAMLLLLR